MWPVLFKIGPITIYSYGFMLVVAFYTCYYLLTKELKRLNYDPKLASDVIFAGAVGGVVGAKVYYLLEHLDRVIADPVGMIFSGSGLVFYGGLIGGTLGVSWVVKKNKINWFTFADIVAPLIILGHAIGRIGCFLVGDDYGTPTRLPWGVSFPQGLPPTTTQAFETYYPWIDISGFEPGLITVHPTQLYEAFLMFLIFLYLWRKRKAIRTPGSLFFTYLVLTGIERFCLEFIRTNPKYLFHLSGAQLISLLLIGIGTIFLTHPLKSGAEQSPD
jgi:phosphatidylglycerol:prolipoprotein diacylglycerol transferase